MKILMLWTFMRVQILLYIIVIFNCNICVASPKCGLYGAPPCQFVPAPLGTTPSCAAPGKTYCESVHQYPVHIIRNILSKFNFDIRHLLADETFEEFESVRHRLAAQRPQFIGPSFPYPTKSTVDEGYHYSNPNVHGYTYRIPPNSFDTGNSYNEQHPGPIYIPSPFSDQKYPNYKQTNTAYRGGGQELYQTNQNFNGNQNNDFYIEQQQITEYNAANVYRRYTRNTDKNDISSENNHYAASSSSPASSSSSSSSLPLSLSPPSLLSNQELQSILLQQLDGNHTDRNATRVKRQTAGRETLCQTNSQFIAPQAALSSRGNWMYVVNHMETGRQLVKTETCASTVCSNLCQLPNGYNSRCEQKYVQKRLVALHNNGQQLYTDTFWFPSCCVCTLSNQ